MKKNKNVILAAAFTVFVALVIFILVYAADMFYNLALNPEYPKDKVFSSENLAPSKDFSYLDIKGKMRNMEEKASLESLESADGLILKGYVLRNPKGKGRWAIIIHGYMQSPLSMAPNSEEFYKRGFSVLLPALRGHAPSEGNYIGMGWPDRKDILLWIDKIIKEDPEAEIVLYGISMGGATVMTVSGEELPENVKCLIEDCGFTSAWDEFAYQLKELFGLPAFPLMKAVDLLAKARAGYGLKEASPLEQVKKCSRPMLFIHGDGDKFVPFYMFEVLYSSASCPKEALAVPGAGHGEAYKTAPEIYWDAVFRFVEKYIAL